MTNIPDRWKLILEVSEEVESELRRLRAIEAATRKLFTRGWRCNGPMHVTLTVSDAEYDAVMAALAAKETP